MLQGSECGLNLRCDGLLILARVHLQHSAVLCSVKCEDICSHLDQAPRVLLQHRPTLVLEGGAPTPSVIVSIAISIIVSIVICIVITVLLALTAHLLLMASSLSSKLPLSSSLETITS